jgi:hypothetical protein
MQNGNEKHDEEWLELTDDGNITGFRDGKGEKQREIGDCIREGAGERRKSGSA